MLKSVHKLIISRADKGWTQFNAQVVSNKEC